MNPSGVPSNRALLFSHIIASPGLRFHPFFRHFIRLCFASYPGPHRTLQLNVEGFCAFLPTVLKFYHPNLPEKYCKRLLFCTPCISAGLATFAFPFGKSFFALAQTHEIG